MAGKAPVYALLGFLGAYSGAFFIGGYVSFFDSISRAIGTDGSGGGALVELGKPLGFANSSEGLFNNPGVKEAAVIAAMAYGVPAGLEYFGAGAAAGGASASTAGVLGSTSYGLDVAALGSTIVSGAKTASSVLGVVNAAKSVAGGSKSAAVVPYGYSQPLGVGYVAPMAQKTGAAMDKTSASSAGGVSVETKSKDSTLTILASALTVAAILYQFSKGK